MLTYWRFYKYGKRERMSRVELLELRLSMVMYANMG